MGRRRRNFITCTIILNVYQRICPLSGYSKRWWAYLLKSMAAMGITECKGLTACLSEHPVS